MYQNRSRTFLTSRKQGKGDKFAPPVTKQNSSHTSYALVKLRTFFFSKKKKNNKKKVVFKKHGECLEVKKKVLDHICATDKLSLEIFYFTNLKTTGCKKSSFQCFFFLFFFLSYTSRLFYFSFSQVIFRKCDTKKRHRICSSFQEMFAFRKDF